MNRVVYTCALAGMMAVGCGGGSGGSTPTSPSSPSPTTPAPDPTPPGPITSGVFTFTFGTGTSSSDQQLIQSAATFAAGFYTSLVGRTLQQASAVSTSTTAQGCALGGGAAAFTGAKTVTFCVGNQGWMALGPVNRQKVVIHEIFHLLQFEMGWLGNPQTAGANWIIEGTAEYVGWQGVASEGLVTFDTVRGCMAKEVSDFAIRTPPGLPNLSAFETQQAFQQTAGPLYPLSMLGVDPIVTGRGINALMAYGSSVAQHTAWPTAFQNSFGASTADFYTQWPPYLASRPVPANYACGI